MRELSLFREIKLKNCLVALLGSWILAFGLYHVHAMSGVTEGGVLGLELLLQYWFDVSPAISGFVMNVVCYLLGWKILGKTFLLYSSVSTVGFSLGYWLCEQTPPLWPQLYAKPLLAAILGAVFVGVGAGLCVRTGGAPTGDDALAMSLSRILRVKLQWVYLLSDLVVLGLSLSYIPLQRIAYSLLTVVLSGQLVGLMQKPLPKRKQEPIE